MKEEAGWRGGGWWKCKNVIIIVGANDALIDDHFGEINERHYNHRSARAQSSAVKGVSYLCSALNLSSASLAATNLKYVYIG
jgi:hypothetical protein